MAEEQVYQATRKVYALYGNFFRVVADEVGIERALQLHSQAHADQGIAAGTLLKHKLGDASFDVAKLGEVLRDSNLSIGIDSELASSTASSAVFCNARCPMYDGYRQGGVDNETAEALCHVGAAAKLGRLLGELDPRITYRLNYYREKPEETCEEEILYASESAA